MTGEKPKISVIIVNYNGKELLQGCLASLATQSFKDFETIVVDNGSKDQSIAYIISEHPKVNIIENNINNYATGNNLGIKKSGGEYIFILNNDTELDKYCLEQLYKAARNSGTIIGMWATKILNYHQRNIIDNTGLLIYPDGMSRGRGRLESDQNQYEQIEEVGIPSGCAALYKKQVFDEVGLFDEDFEFFVEDSDLGMRARLAGWRCLFVPKAKLYHKYSATSGQYSPRKAFLVERNRLWLAIKILPLSLVLLSPYFSFKRYLYQIYGIINKKGSAGKFVQEFSKFQLIIILLKAWFSALIGLPKMLKKRKVIQRKKKISNKEIFSWFKKFGISAKELALKD